MKVTLRIRRQRPGMKARWQSYEVDAAPDAYVLDALEIAYAQDASLVFRHACHHASCGSCAVRINGREALPCIVRVSAAARRGGTITLEPLRNLPVLADLAVDREPMLRTLRQIGMTCIRAAEDGAPAEGSGLVTRFEDCIECGICVSACPVAGAEGAYLGPAAMAAADRVLAGPDRSEFGATGTADSAAVFALVNSRHGVWRCHGAFECTEVCPMAVDPGGAIMRLRRRSYAQGGKS